jgi:hypothetical protein
VWRFDPSVGRDLRLYEFGGHFEECSARTGRQERECLKKRKEARKFLYARWRSKKPAYIAIDFPCTDCGPTLHVFVDQDEAGRWRIARVLEESRYPPMYWEDAFDVRYRWANEDDRLREQATRVLSFVDSSGVELDSF